MVRKVKESVNQAGLTAEMVAGIFTRLKDTKHPLSIADRIRVLEQRISDLERDKHDLLAFRNEQTNWDYKIIGYLKEEK